MKFKKRVIVGIITPLVLMAINSSAWAASPVKDKKSPVISQLMAESNSFGPISPVPEKLQVQYKLDEDAKIKILISDNKTYKKPTLLAALSGKKGLNKYNWDGKLNNHFVGTGNYYLTFIGTDKVGNTSAGKKITITIQGLDEKAKRMVSNLFKNSTKTALATNLTQAMADNANTVVEALPEGALKVSLETDLDQYDQLLATDRVNHLFANSNKISLSSGVSQTNIDDALALVNVLPDESDLKQSLYTDILKAQEYLDITALDLIINGLFADSTKTTLALGITQEKIDSAMEMVDGLPESYTKTIDGEIIGHAQDIIKALAEAPSTVASLFIDNTKTALKAEITQDDIDSAQEMVNNLPNGETKTQLQADIDKASSLIKK